MMTGRVKYFLDYADCVSADTACGPITAGRGNLNRGRALLYHSCAAATEITKNGEISFADALFI